MTTMHLQMPSRLTEDQRQALMHLREMKKAFEEYIDLHEPNWELRTAKSKMASAIEYAERGLMK